MVAAALGSCMLTLMGIAARRLEIDLKGTRVEIQKVMAAEPRRIAEIRLDFYLPGDYSDKDKKILQGAAETCPVGNLVINKEMFNFGSGGKLLPALFREFSELSEQGSTENPEINPL